MTMSYESEDEDYTKEVDPEIEKEIEEAFQKVDWDNMEKHLKSEGALKQFAEIKKGVRFRFDCVHNLASYRKVPNSLLSYYDVLYPKPASEGLTLGKLIQKKLLVKGEMLMKRNFFKTWGLGSALALTFTGLYFANRKDAERMQTAE